MRSAWEDYVLPQARITSPSFRQNAMMLHTRFLLAAFTFLILTSCATSVIPPVQEEPSSPSETTSTFSLQGDESFSPASLTAEQRLWYDRVLVAMKASTSDMIRRAESDNSYLYGRTLYQYNSALLMALRSTGDLQFLDEVDKVAEALRRQLYDGWCGDVETTVTVNARYGTVHSPDGYLNFRRRSSSARDNCRDVSDLEEALIHGHLALVMYAYHVNRDLVGPAGINYAERADFWFDYLRNHFEAKWRGRSDTAWPDMNFMDLKFCHTYSQMTLYFYFMGKRLESSGDPHARAYLGYAASMTDAMFDLPYVPGSYTGGFVDTSAAYGDAVIYSFGAPNRNRVSATHLEACPMTYARYVNSSITTLRLENVARWDDAIMTKLANGMTSFVFDSPSIRSWSDTVAAGVSGSSTLEQLPPTAYSSRLTIGKYANSLLSTLSAWDASGTIERLTMEAYAIGESSPDSPTRVYLPSTMLFLETASRDALGATAGR